MARRHTHQGQIVKQIGKSTHYSRWVKRNQAKVKKPRAKCGKSM
jgi:hypothetical protein